MSLMNENEYGLRKLAFWFLEQNLVVTMLSLTASDRTELSFVQVLSLALALPYGGSGMNEAVM